VAIGTAMNGTRSGGPHELIAIRPPGFKKRRTRAAAPSPSGSKMIPQRDRAASKLLGGKSSEAASDSTNRTFWSFAAAARSRPYSSIPAEMSVATTSPCAPTVLAAMSEGFAVASGDVEHAAARAARDP
jgi:hypothetical protein